MYFWKTKKLPERKNIIGSHLEIMVFFFLLGVCVICWAAYWNTGFSLIWLFIAGVVFLITGDLLLTEVVYLIGSIAITDSNNRGICRRIFKGITIYSSIFCRFKEKEKSRSKG
ncbi:MAG: hypothetical protein ACTSP6_02580 [Promethearchaeota archaeon]